MTMAVFVWTFHGICEAIGLAVLLGIFLLAGLLAALVKLLDWFDRIKKQHNNSREAR
jgi:hypothetical protein